MDFMAGTDMTPEKEEALLELARLCESQASSADQLGKLAAHAVAGLKDVAAWATEAAEERKATAAALRARAEGAENEAIADASNGNWEVLKIIDSMSRFGWIAEMPAAYKETADADKAKAVDILWQLID